MNYTAADVKKGLSIVMGILALVLLLELINIIQALVYNTLGPTTFIRLTLVLWMCWAIYTGRLWARIVFSVLTLIGSVFTLIAAFGFGSGLYGLLGFIQLTCALSLWVVPAVNAYFEYVAAQVGS